MSKRITNQTPTLRRLINSRGSLCEFCEQPVVMIASITETRRIKQEAFWLTYHVHRKKIERTRIATIEHLQRLCDGGTNDFSNMKVCCAECNNLRAIESHEVEHGPKSKNCRHCGAKFGSKVMKFRSSKSCVDCHRRNSRFFTSENKSSGIGDMISSVQARNKENLQ